MKVCNTRFLKQSSHFTHPLPFYGKNVGEGGGGGGMREVPTMNISNTD